MPKAKRFRYDGHVDKMLSPAVVLIADDFKRRMYDRFGARLLEYAVFGSQVRGLAHALSDVDVFVVIRDLTSSERTEIYELAGEIWVDTGARIAPLARSDGEVKEMRRLERRLIRDIDSEGISR